MKTLILLGSLLFTLSTLVEPIWAEDGSTVSTSLNDNSFPFHLSDLGVHINPQLGISSFDYSGMSGGGAQKLTGGATAEFGEGPHKLETGLLFMQTGGNATLNDGTTGRLNLTYLAIPMMAKLRVYSLPSQSWYAKFGVVTAFEVGSSNPSVTGGSEVLASAGIGARFAFTKRADFIVEGTYNRGVLETVQSSAGSSYLEGFLFLAGLSFSI